MANLQQNLDPITRGKSITAAPDNGPNALAGLASLGSALLGAGQNYQQMERNKTLQARQDTQWAQQQADYAEQQQGKKSADELAQGLVGILQTPTSTANIPAAVQADVNQITRAQKGVGQGLVPQESVDLQIEKLVTSTVQKYPEQADEILQWAATKGLDHVIFRQRRGELDAQAQEDQLQLAAQKSDYEMAIKSGYDPQDSYEGGIIFGAKLRANQALVDAQTAQIDLQTKRANLSKLDMDQLKTQKSESLFNFLQGDASTKLGYLTQRLGVLVTEAGQDPAKLRDLQNLPGLINSGVEAYRTSVLAQVAKSGGTPEDFTKANSMVDTYAKSLTDLYTGDLNQIKANNTAYSSMQTQWKLDAAKAAPLYSKMVSLLGAQTVNEMIGTNVLNETQVTAIGNELAGIDIGSPDGMVAINNIAAVIKGKTNIKNLTRPEDRVAALKTANAAVTANKTAAYAGDASATQQFADGYSVGLNAAVDLNPATATKDDIVGAAQLFFDPSNQAILKRIMSDPNQGARGQSMMIASRGAAVRVLESARGSATVTSKPSVYQHVGLDPTTGKYIVIWEDSRFNADYKSGKFDRPSNSGNPMSAGGYGSNSRPDLNTLKTRLIAVNPDLKSVAAAMNMSVDHLVATDDSDPTMVKGLSAAEQRTFWTTGKLPAGKVPKPGSSQQAKPADWNKQLEEFGGLIRDFTFNTVDSANLSGSGVTARAGEISSSLSGAFHAAGVNLPPAAVAGIVGNLTYESGLNTAATNRGDGSDGSDSIGLAQWNADRAVGLKKFAEQNGLNWTDISAQTQYIVKELTTDHPEVLKKLQVATPEEAADIFAKYFLRPAGSNKEGFGSIMGRDQRRSAALSAYNSGSQ